MCVSPAREGRRRAAATRTDASGSWHAFASCRGDSGEVYTLAVDHRGWSCSCPAVTGACSHLVALRLCVLRPFPRSDPEPHPQPTGTNDERTNRTAQHRNGGYLRHFVEEHLEKGEGPSPRTMTQARPSRDASSKASSQRPPRSSMRRGTLKPVRRARSSCASVRSACPSKSTTPRSRNAPASCSPPPTNCSKRSDRDQLRRRPKPGRVSVDILGVVVQMPNRRVRRTVERDKSGQIASISTSRSTSETLRGVGSGCEKPTVRSAQL